MFFPFEIIGGWNDVILVQENNWKSVYKENRLKDYKLYTLHSNSNTQTG